MDFIGTGKRLAPEDFQNAATMLGCDVPTVQAVVDVEAAGKGFDASSRPKILFEPHRFYAVLGKGEKRQRAVAAGLAYPKWGEQPYPKTSEGNYQRLRAAMAIDEEAALKACSWGLPQIMGENHRAAGYPSAAAMVDAFKSGEGEQLGAFARCVDAFELEDELRRKDWKGFARGYNGPGYAKNSYDTKLAAAFRRRSAGKPVAEKDHVPVDSRVPLPQSRPADAPKSSDPVTDPAVIERVQRRLKELGYFEVGKADGGEGGLRRTEAAILAFRNDNGLPLTPTIDDELLLALEKAKPREVSPERAEAKPTEVANHVPSLRATLRNRLTAIWAGILSFFSLIVSAIAEFFQEAWEKLEPVRDVLESVPGYMWFGIAAALCIFFYFNAQRNVAETTEAFKKGQLL